MAIDFNSAGAQRTFDVIPDDTICTIQLNIKPGAAGPDGNLTLSKKGDSSHLACEHTVVAPPEHAKRKFWSRYTVEGANHAGAIEISNKLFKAILESVRGIKPNDTSDAAKAARQIQSWGDLDMLRFDVRIGIEPPANGYAAKNTIKEVITPDRKEYKKIEQIDRSNLPKSGMPGAAGAAAATPEPAPPPANAISRPDWAR
jgi:hypothetical protein